MTLLNILSGLNIKHIYILSLVLIYFLGSVFFYKKIFGDPELKKFFLDSMRENTGKASGKSLTAFLLSNIVAIATIIAVIYSPNHLLPEYFLISVLTFVASLYGISMASKYFGNGSGSGNTAPNTSENKDSVIEEKDKKKETPKDDIG